MKRTSYAAGYYGALKRCLMCSCSGRDGIFRALKRHNLGNPKQECRSNPLFSREKASLKRCINLMCFFLINAQKLSSRSTRRSGSCDLTSKINCHQAEIHSVVTARPGRAHARHTLKLSLTLFEKHCLSSILFPSLLLLPLSHFRHFTVFPLSIMQHRRRQRTQAFLPVSPVSSTSFVQLGRSSRSCRVALWRVNSPLAPRIAFLPKMSSVDTDSTDVSMPQVSMTETQPVEEAEAGESDNSALVSDTLDKAELPEPEIPDGDIDPSVVGETAVVTVSEVDAKDSTWLESVLASAGNMRTEHPLAPLRAKAMLEMSGLQVPTRRMEPWRFTDLKSIYESRYGKPEEKVDISGFQIRKYVPDTVGVALVFVDGVYNEEMSMIGDESAQNWENAGGYFGSVGKYTGNTGELRRLFVERELGTGKDGGMFPLLAHAIGTDAAVIDVPNGYAVERPVAVLFLSTSGGSAKTATASSTRLAVLAGKESKITILESHVSLDNENSYSLALGSTTVKVNDAAQVQHYILNNACQESHVISNVHAEVHRNGSYESRSLGIGSKVGRLNIGIDLIGDGSHGAVFGALISDEYQVLDIHSRINHDAKNTTSEQLQKNIAADHARAVFKGVINITENGAGTNSDQLCRSLLLSSKAMVDAMPVLEVANDDVQCTHGATVSDLEADQMFYCQSRGLTVDEAQQLLIRGFALDIIGDCPYPTVAEQVNEKVSTLSARLPKREFLSSEFTST